MTEFMQVGVELIKTNAHNVRTHSKRQIRQIADSISQFGFVKTIRKSSRARRLQP